MIALLLLASAHGYELTGMAIPDEDLPLEIWLAGEQEETVPDGYVYEAFELAAAQWREASCGVLDAAIVGTLDEATGFDRNGVNTLSFNDPDGELQGGVQGATLAWPGTEWLFEVGRETFRATEEVDFVFNDGVDFATEAEAESADCRDSISLVAELVHQLGHAFGLGHSCEEGESDCPEELREASMYWQVSECSTEASTVALDDEDGARLLAGLTPSLRCEALGERVGPPGQVTLECGPEGRHPEWFTEVTWFPGTGAEITGPTMVHTYQDPGVYEVEACYEFEDPCSGPTSDCDTFGLVVVCEPSFDPAMEVVRVSHTMVRLANLGSQDPCTPEWRWSITDAADEEVFTSQAWAPVAELAPGSYRVTLTFEPYFEEEVPPLREDIVIPWPDEGGGCSTAGSASPWTLLGVALLGRRRRR